MKSSFGGVSSIPADSCRSPTKKNKALVMKSSFGGSDIRDDISVISDVVSRGDDSVATEALEMLVKRVDQCKETLTLTQKSDDGTESSIEKQKEVAQLLEKLAAAALAVKQLEDMDV